MASLMFGVGFPSQPMAVWTPKGWLSMIASPLFGPFPPPTLRLFQQATLPFFPLALGCPCPTGWLYPKSRPCLIASDDRRRPTHLEDARRYGICRHTAKASAQVHGDAFCPLLIGEFYLPVRWGALNRPVMCPLLRTLFKRKF